MKSWNLENSFEEENEMLSRSISRLDCFGNANWKNLEKFFCSRSTVSEFQIFQIRKSKVSFKNLKKFLMESWNLENSFKWDDKMLSRAISRLSYFGNANWKNWKNSSATKRSNRSFIFSRFELLRSKNITILKNLSSIRLFKITSSYQIRCYIFHLEKSKVRNVFIDEEYESWQRFENLKVISVCFEFL